MVIIIYYSELCDGNPIDYEDLWRLLYARCIPVIVP